MQATLRAQVNNMQIQVLSLRTLASGARQLVVHDALETTSIEDGSYLSSLTPITNIGASADGAEMITFFAPPFRCAAAWGAKTRSQQSPSPHRPQHPINPSLCSAKRDVRVELQHMLPCCRWSLRA